MTYPESVPPSSKITMDTFNFSFSLVDKAREDIQSDYDSLSERIEAIVESEKFYVNNYPVLKQILMIGAKKNDLKKLSKALARLSELVEIHSQLENKLGVINTLSNQPHWFTSTFGDFSKEIDASIEDIFKDLED
jgi:hypothetical protein